MGTMHLLCEDSAQELKNASFRTPSIEELTLPGGANRRETMPMWRRYMVAALCVLIAFLIRYMLTPVLGEELPFMMFIAAALVAAWYGEAVTGIAALALGLFLADYIFLPSRTTAQPIEVVRLIRYVFTASLGIGLIEILHRARRRTEAMVEELSWEVERRKRSEARSLEAEVQLNEHAQQLEHRVGDQTAKLADTVESLKNLLYFIAHNLRAPLRAMEGYASLLVSECGSNLDPNAKDYSRHISAAAKRMDLLIQGLLDYGRLGHVEVRLDKISLSEIVETALFGLAFEIQASSAKVQVLGTLGEALANANVLEAVVTNLLENAIKFVQPGSIPKVEIWSESGESWVRLWVKDNGIGIDPQFHERIFSAFETLSSVSLNHGTGIGLAIVKQGIQRMGGHVGVESRLGAGSRFWIELPVPSALEVKAKENARSVL